MPFPFSFHPPAPRTVQTSRFPENEMTTLRDPLTDLRDWFAGMALCGLMQRSPRRLNFDEWSIEAYQLADFMMQARRPKPQESDDA